MAMHFKSEKISLLLLGMIALVGSRVMLWLFNDPEGPNLLVVAGMGAVVYMPSLAAYALNISDSKKLLWAISIQLVIITVLYFCLK